MVRASDRQFALEQYRKRAGAYDLELAAFEPIRRMQLTPGDTVLDVGCGTGLSFGLLQRAIGSGGHIVGIEQCPEMLARARARVAEQGWANVTLINSPIQQARITRKADAAIFHFTHDILRDEQAVRKVAQSLKPGARVVAAGLQWAPPWAWLTNTFVMAAALHSVTSLEGGVYIASAVVGP